MTILQLLKGMAIMAALMALTLGVPVSAYFSLRKPRRFVLWPLLFAATAGAFAAVIDVGGYVVSARRIHQTYTEIPCPRPQPGYVCRLTRYRPLFHR